MTVDTPDVDPHALTAQDIRNIFKLVKDAQVPFEQLEVALALKVKLIKLHNDLEPKDDPVD